MRKAMGVALALVLTLLALGCAREDPFVTEMRAGMKKGTVLVVTAGESRSYEVGTAIWTEHTVTVKRSNRPEYAPNETVKIHALGGAIPEEAHTRIMTVNNGVVLSNGTEGDAVVVVKKQGDRLVVLGALPLEDGRVALDHPFRSLFNQALVELPR